MAQGITKSTYVWLILTTIIWTIFGVILMFTPEVYNLIISYENTNLTLDRFLGAFCLAIAYGHILAIRSGVKDSIRLIFKLSLIVNIILVVLFIYLLIFGPSTGEPLVSLLTTITGSSMHGFFVVGYGYFLKQLASES